jgi:transglutaminase-like putative cysteine protease
MLAAVTAVWTASFSAHALAIRAGSPLLAVLPPIALVGFADTVLEDGARPVYAIVLLCAALAVIFSDGLRRIRQWGPVWSSSRSHRLGSSVKGSRPVAAAVVLAAVLVPGVLPGFRSGPLVDLSTESGEGFDLNGFISIQAQLDDEEPADLFEVDAEAGRYWRTRAYDVFDGANFSNGDPLSEEGALVYSPPAELPPGGEAVPDGAPSRSYLFRILQGTEAPWLPLPQGTESLSIAVDEIRYDPVDGQVLVDGGLDATLEYSAKARWVTPTPAQLDTASLEMLTGGQSAVWTSVPDSLDPRVRELALQWTEGEPNPYRQVLAIQDHLQEGFAYDREVDLMGSPDALLEFLTETRVGACQQFSVAMAAMVRSLGYPARIASGYQAGTETEDGTFLVKSSDAHAWVEVLFPDYGWLAFEPTPTRGVRPAAVPDTYLNPTTPAAPIPGGEDRPGANLPRGGAGAEGCENAGVPGQLCNSDFLNPGASGGVDALPPGFLQGTGPPPPPEDESGYSVPYRWILLGLLALGAILLIVIPIVKVLARRVVLRRSREPREHVLAAYRVFDGEAADIGMGRRAGETLEEHRARLAATVAFSDGHLGRLTDAAERAAYGSMDPTREEADASVRDAHVAIKDLRKQAGVLRRIVGTYRPGL